MTSQRVVVVLGGGGAKAAAHLGVARALREAGITPTVWSGTSMGAVVAAALAQGDDPEAALARFAAFKPEAVLVRDTKALFRGIWAHALVKAEPFRAAIESFLQVRDFDDLATPCAVTAVEVETGREVVFGYGGEHAPLIDALTAACALPPYFAPVTVNGRTFFDGGIRAVLPLDWAAAIPADLVIAVDTGPGFDEIGEPIFQPPRLLSGTDTALGWLMAGTTALLRERWESRPDLPRLLWLRPVRDRGATFAMDRIPQYADLGYREMLRALKEL